MKEQSTSRGFAILSAGTVLVKILSLLYVPIMRAILGDEGYGISGAAYQIYVFIFVITNSGIPVAISKLVSELNATGNYKDAIKGFKLSRFMLMILGIVMSGLLILMAYPLSIAVHYQTAYLSVLALAPAILFTSVASAYRGFFQGSKNMTPTAVSQVAEQTANTVFSIIFAAYLMRYGLELGCAGSSLGTGMGALISACFLVFYYEKNKKSGVLKRKNESGVQRFSNGEIIKKIIQYSLPITMCVGMTYAGNLVDLYNTKVRLMAGGFNDAQATILYGYLVKYQQLLNVPIAIISSLAAAILPALSAAVAVRDKKQLHDKINYSLRICFLVAMPCAAGLGVLSSPVYNMLKFGKGSFIMTYGSVVLILLAVMQIQSTILQGVGKLYMATLFSVIGIAVKIVVNYFMIANPRINILGAVIGSLVGFGVPVLLNQRMINKTLKARVRLFVIAAKPAAAAVLMGVLVYLTHRLLSMLAAAAGGNYIFNSLAVVISVIAGAYYYLFGLIMIKGISSRDMNIMPGKIRKFIPDYFLGKIQ